MSQYFHRLIAQHSDRTPSATALVYKDQHLSYRQLSNQVRQFASGLLHLGLSPGERIAIFLPKIPQAVTAMLASSYAGYVFVPINPVLKPAQVQHILNDCNVRVLITSHDRARQLNEIFSHCDDLHQLILTDGGNFQPQASWLQRLDWQQICETPAVAEEGPRTDADMAAILYTSGSTGHPKGVVVSHRNLVVGADSVASYLCNHSEDKLLALLPFSFDYGLSQLTTAFHVGACCYLMDFLLPRDVLRAVEKHQITGLAAVPPLWAQLAKLDWPADTGHSLRYFTNSGGAMPTALLSRLREIFPNAAPYLMYGLTEAFRSSYLPPELVDQYPNSMGKAIPNAELMVVRSDGSLAADNEPGELVHRGPLVSLGYWNAPEKTAIRFKPSPGRPSELCIPELAVWSGDLVRRDEQGLLYFIGRRDDMIKSSGYRISPTEVEEVIYQSELVTEAAALGIPHHELGQAVVVVYQGKDPSGEHHAALLARCRKELPAFMVPKQLIAHTALPHNANGKIDRKQLTNELIHLFDSELNRDVENDTQ